MFDLVSKSPLQLNTTCKENMKKRFLMCNFTLKLTGIFKCPHWNNWFFNTSHEVPHSIGKYWKISKKTSARNFFFISEYVNRLFTFHLGACLLKEYYVVVFLGFFWHLELFKIPLELQRVVPAFCFVSFLQTSLHENGKEENDKNVSD